MKIRTEACKAVGAGLALLACVAFADTTRPLSILSPRDGAIVGSPVKVVLGGTAKPGMTEHEHASMGVAADHADHAMHEGGHEGGHEGHAHLLVDAPLPQPGTAIPMDDHHIHLMSGETETTLRLAPGRHTLQLILTEHDHTVGKQPAHSPRVAITVKQEAR